MHLIYTSNRLRYVLYNVNTSIRLIIGPTANLVSESNSTKDPMTCPFSDLLYTFLCSRKTTKQPTFLKSHTMKQSKITNGKGSHCIPLLLLMEEIPNNHLDV